MDIFNIFKNEEVIYHFKATRIRMTISRSPGMCFHKRRGMRENIYIIRNKKKNTYKFDHEPHKWAKASTQARVGSSSSIFRINLPAMFCRDRTKR